METNQYTDQEARPTVSIGSLFGAWTPPDTSPRGAFTEEAFWTINMERKDTKYPLMTRRQISLMINFVCPKKAGDAWVHDYRKSCQEAKKKGSYGKAFWGIWKKAKKEKLAEI